MCKVYYHLPGLFEFYEFYRVFLPLFFEHREYFYDFAEIASIYGAPNDCIWGGGRIENEAVGEELVLDLIEKYGISARLTFSNSLITKEHLLDRRCNNICKFFSNTTNTRTGVIVYSDLLLSYLQAEFPDFYYISSTTKVITEFDKLVDEINRSDFTYVVPDFRLNKALDKFNTLKNWQKDKLEMLCNECCSFNCRDRKACYENVSHKNLGDNVPDHVCRAPMGSKGYRFSEAMINPGFISIDDIMHTYLPNGIRNFKLEGRGLGSAVLLEILLYYMVKSEYQLKIREEIYLDSMLDLF